MAVIHDVMPAFELFQPASIGDAVTLLNRYGPNAWVMAGGMDSFDWLKDRIKRPSVVIDLSQIEEPARHQGRERRPRDRCRHDAHRGRPAIRWCVRSSGCWRRPPSSSPRRRSATRGRSAATCRRTRAAGTTARDGRATGPAATSATPTRRRRSIASTRFSTPIVAWR